MRMRATLGPAVLTVLMLPMPLWSCSEGGADRSVGGETDAAASPAPPAGLLRRLDRTNRDPADFRVSGIDGRLHIQTGPAGILYRPEDLVESGDFTVSVTLTELDAPSGHREGFGVFIGGQALQGSGQRYTYFLVRADGSYLVKYREGDSTVNLTEGGWRPSDAVTVGGDVDVTNALSVNVIGGMIRFAVNGIEVEEVPTGGLPVHGVIGLRVNHNLNIVVEGLSVTR